MGQVKDDGDADTEDGAGKGAKATSVDGVVRAADRAGRSNTTLPAVIDSKPVKRRATGANVI